MSLQGNKIKTLVMPLGGMITPVQTKAYKTCKKVMISHSLRGV